MLYGASGTRISVLPICTRTYIPMRRGFLYLVAVMDWSTRKGLSWRVSITWMGTFASRRRKKRWICLAGSQFTSPRFTEVLIAAGVHISMDGRGRWMDNVFIERLWRSLKYECVYLHAFECRRLRNGPIFADRS